MSQQNPVLVLKDVSVNGIEPINLSLNKGECICVTGPSGSGKSLLLRALVDLIPHQGEVYFHGQACHDFSPPQWRKQVGMLPAESAWWAEQVGDHFATRCDESIARLGFDKDVYQWSVSRCSTGERQRLALLRLLCLKPDVLLLDEPTASLDEQNVMVVESLIKEYQQQGGSVIWVSHDQEQIRRVADRLFRIQDRQLVEVSS